MVGPGAVITLRAGTYPGFSLGFKQVRPYNSRTSGGTAAQPITIEGEGDVRIVPRRDVHDTISVNQEIKNGHYVFRNLEIEPGQRAGIMFFKLRKNQVHEGFHFEDVDIKGSWDHTTHSGKQSKWAVWGHSLSDFQFRGVSRFPMIERIRLEHAFYLQNLKGDVLIERVRARRLGRTFCQFTARAADGAPGVGSITVRDCEVQDTGLSEWDEYKGGFAFTIAGRIKGPVLFENNKYRAGFDPELRRLTKKGAPYGTGALVLWDGGEKMPNARVTLRDNDFEFAPRCGDRAVVSIGGCKEVLVLGHNRFVSGGRYPALVIDPTHDGKPNGKLVNIPNGRVHVAPETVTKGGFELRGRKPNAEDLKRLHELPRLR